MRLVLRGLALAIPLLFFHVACGGDDGGGSGGNVTPTDEGGITPTNDGGSPVDTGTQQPVPDADPPPPPIVTLTSETIDVDGTSRTYVLAVPVSYDASKKYPLVLELHGDGEDGVGMQKVYPFEKASQQEAIIAYPNGNGWDLYTPPDTNADFKFLQQLVTALAGKYDIDTGRVYGFGYSSGAFMVNQLGCKLDGFLRAIGPNEGGAPADDSNGTTRTCPSAQPLGVFVFHGDDDQVVDIGSGTFEVKYWAQRMGCSATQTEDITPSPCKRQLNCPAASPVTFCEIPVLGHAVWNQAAAASWTWFKALP